MKSTFPMVLTIYDVYEFNNSFIRILVSKRRGELDTTLIWKGDCLLWVIATSLTNLLSTVQLIIQECSFSM